MVELIAGEPGHAEEILVPSVEALRAGSDVSWLATNSAWLAEAQYNQGRVDDALRTSEYALSVSPPGFLSALTVAGRAHAKALARAGRSSEARKLAVETRELLAETDAINERGEVAASAAEVHALAGDDEGAGRLTAEAISWFEQKGNLVSAARLREQRTPA